MVPLSRLKRREDFLAAGKCKRIATTTMVVQFRDRSAETPSYCSENPHSIRVGFTVTRKTGNSVVRNRIKRRMREASRAVIAVHGKPDGDYVLIGRTACAEKPYHELIRDLSYAMRKLHGKDTASCSA